MTIEFKPKRRAAGALPVSPAELEPDIDYSDWDDELERGARRVAIRELEWGGSLYELWLSLDEGAHWDTTKHPRWPKDTPGGLGGKFMEVGQRFEHNGVQYDVAIVEPGKVWAHVATHGTKAAPKLVEFTSDQLKLDSEGHATAVTRPPAEVIKGVKAGSWRSVTATVIDPYVDHASHDPSIAIPEGSSITPEEWMQFGRADQERYAQVTEMVKEKFGYTMWKAGIAQTAIDKTLAAGDEHSSSILKSSYGSQFGQSTGFTISLHGMWNGLLDKVKGSPALEKKRTEYEAARALQDQAAAVIQWDLYNRTHSPDVAIFHKHSDHGLFQNEIINGSKPVFAGLSQSQWYRPGWWAPNAFMTPMAVRNIVMSTVSGSIKAPGVFKDEWEVATADPYFADSRSIETPDSGLAPMQKKWLHQVSEHGIGGHAIALLQQSMKANDAGVNLPVQPSQPIISMDGEGGQEFVSPPEQATKFADVNGKQTPISDLLYFNTTPEGKPIVQQVKEMVDAGELGIGDYIEGLQGTRYIVVPMPSNSFNGMGYYKITDASSLQKIPGTENGAAVAFTGHKPWTGGEEVYPFTASSGEKGFKKLAGHYEFQAPKKEGVPQFNMNAWSVDGPAQSKWGKDYKPGEKFMVAGKPYEVVADLANGKKKIKDLTTGKLGEVNGDFKTPPLVLKAGYSETGEAQLDPADFFTGPAQPHSKSIGQVVQIGSYLYQVAKGSSVPNVTLTQMSGDNVGKQVEVNWTGLGSVMIPKPPGWTTPQKGDTFAFNGKKATVTKVLKNGDIRAKTAEGAKTLLPQDPVFAYVHRPDDWKVGPKTKLKDMAVGDRFHGGAGQAVRPYLVLAHPKKGEVKVRNLDTGDEMVMSANKSYALLVHAAKVAVAPPVDHTTPTSPSETYDPSAWMAGPHKSASELEVGDKVLSPTFGVPWELVDKQFKGGDSMWTAKNLITGETAGFTPSGMTTLVPKVVQVPQVAEVVPEPPPEPSLAAAGWQKAQVQVGTLEVGDQFALHDPTKPSAVWEVTGKTDKGVEWKLVQSPDVTQVGKTGSTSSGLTAAFFKPKAAQAQTTKVYGTTLKTGDVVMYAGKHYTVGQKDLPGDTAFAMAGPGDMIGIEPGKQYDAVSFNVPHAWHTAADTAAGKQLVPNTVPLGELPVGTRVQATPSATTKTSAVWEITGHGVSQTEVKLVKDGVFTNGKPMGNPIGKKNAFSNKMVLAFATPKTEAPAEAPEFSPNTVPLASLPIGTQVKTLVLPDDPLESPGVWEIVGPAAGGVKLKIVKEGVYKTGGTQKNLGETNKFEGTQVFELAKPPAGSPGAFEAISKALETPKAGTPFDQTAYTFDTQPKHSTLTLGDLTKGQVFKGKTGKFFEIKSVSGANVYATNLETGKYTKLAAKIKPAALLHPKSGGGPGDTPPVPYDELKAGDPTTLGDLKAGDRVTLPDIGSPTVYQVMTPSLGKPEQPVMIAPLNALGQLGPQSPSGPQTKAVLHAKFGDWSDTSTAAVADVVSPDVSQYKEIQPDEFSSYSAGPHVFAIKSMAKGAVFEDTNGVMYKVKKSGAQPLVTDGDEIYSIDGNWHGLNISDTTDGSAFHDSTPDIPQTAGEVTQFAAGQGLAPNTASANLFDLGIGKGDTFQDADGSVWISQDNASLEPLQAYQPATGATKSFDTNTVPKAWKLGHGDDVFFEEPEPSGLPEIPQGALENTLPLSQLAVGAEFQLDPGSAIVWKIESKDKKTVKASTPGAGVSVFSGNEVPPVIGPEGSLSKPTPAAPDPTGVPSTGELELPDGLPDKPEDYEETGKGFLSDAQPGSFFKTATGWVFMVSKKEPENALSVKVAASPPGAEWMGENKAWGGAAVTFVKPKYTPGDVSVSSKDVPVGAPIKPSQVEVGDVVDVPSSGFRFEVTAKGQPMYPAKGDTDVYPAPSFSITLKNVENGVEGSGFYNDANTTGWVKAPKPEQKPEGWSHVGTTEGDTTTVADLDVGDQFSTGDPSLPTTTVWEVTGKSSDSGFPHVQFEIVQLDPSKVNTNLHVGSAGSTPATFAPEWVKKQSPKPEPTPSVTLVKPLNAVEQLHAPPLVVAPDSAEGKPAFDYKKGDVIRQAGQYGGGVYEVAADPKAQTPANKYYSTKLQVKVVKPTLGTSQKVGDETGIWVYGSQKFVPASKDGPLWRLGEYAKVVKSGNKTGKTAKVVGYTSDGKLEMQYANGKVEQATHAELQGISPQWKTVEKLAGEPRPASQLHVGDVFGTTTHAASAPQVVLSKNPDGSIESQVWGTGVNSTIKHKADTDVYLLASKRALAGYGDIAPAPAPTSSSSSGAATEAPTEAPTDPDSPLFVENGAPLSLLAVGDRFVYQGGVFEVVPTPDDASDPSAPYAKVITPIPVVGNALPVGEESPFQLGTTPDKVWESGGPTNPAVANAMAVKKVGDKVTPAQVKPGMTIETADGARYYIHSAELNPDYPGSTGLSTADDQGYKITAEVLDPADKPLDVGEEVNWKWTSAAITDWKLVSTTEKPKYQPWQNNNTQLSELPAGTQFKWATNGIAWEVLPWSQQSEDNPNTFAKKVGDPNDQEEEFGDSKPVEVRYPFGVDPESAPPAWADAPMGDEPEAGAPSGPYPTKVGDVQVGDLFEPSEGEHYGQKWIAKTVGPGGVAAEPLDGGLAQLFPLSMGLESWTSKDAWGPPTPPPGAKMKPLESLSPYSQFEVSPQTPVQGVPPGIYTVMPQTFVPPDDELEAFLKAQHADQLDNVLWAQNQVTGKHEWFGKDLPVPEIAPVAPSHAPAAMTGPNKAPGQKLASVGDLAPGDYIATGLDNTYRIDATEQTGPGVWMLTMTLVNAKGTTSHPTGHQFVTPYEDAYLPDWTYAEAPAVQASVPVSAEGTDVLEPYIWPKSGGKKFPKIGTLAPGTVFRDKKKVEYTVLGKSGGVVHYLGPGDVEYATSEASRVFVISTPDD